MRLIRGGGSETKREKTKNTSRELFRAGLMKSQNLGEGTGYFILRAQFSPSYGSRSSIVIFATGEQFGPCD
jgi:hypothetical protein